MFVPYDRKTGPELSKYLKSQGPQPFVIISKTHISAPKTLKIADMKFVTFLILIVASFSAFAGDIVLMTSLELKNRNINYLEKKFNTAFKDSGHELVIHHKADPKILYTVMTSEKTEAVIWVSHAAGEQNLKPGFKAEDIILDIWGNDVKNFFTLVPPNLKFIGLVGCQAQKIINGFTERGNYVNYPDLEIMSFEKKVRLYSAFKKTLKAAKEFLAKAEQPKTIAAHKVEFQVERSVYEESPTLQSAWLEIGDQVLAFFDVDQVLPVNEVSIAETVYNKIDRKNMKLFRSRTETSNDDSLGKLTIIPAQNIGSWNLFGRDGRPIGGKDQQLYVFKRP